jgi:hypothetical protein
LQRCHNIVSPATFRPQDRAYASYGRNDGTGLIWNYIPEDETGDRPPQERAHWLTHAEFFVGLSSSLSWLAWPWELRW